MDQHELEHGLRQQFGAAIDMLENAIGACPEALWSDPYSALRRNAVHQPFTLPPR
ncbi:MAG TPA: hypothetical protein VFW83_09155 [Bryobacteraceae bacterium]|nr:hypothetical protein [Bryobacteraceae bacterium]